MGAEASFSSVAHALQRHRSTQTPPCSGQASDAPTGPKARSPIPAAAPTVSSKSEETCSELPNDDAVLKTLAQAGRPLAVREVYLLSLGRDPKLDQMGAGVRRPMNRLLYALQEAGRVTGAGGMWQLP